MDDQQNQPHAPDVLDRETEDGGFSAGWGFHMQPSVRYWIDSHTHMAEKASDDMRQSVADWHQFMWAFRLRRHVAVDGEYQRWESLAAAARSDDRLIWHCRLAPDKPDRDHLRRCRDAGAVGLKLHNSKLMMGEVDRAFVLSDAWHKIYDLAGQLGMPVLWHVTQRLTECPYTGGGHDSYWKVGRPRGVSFTNEDLLADFLRIVAEHRHTQFIGAHQLHMGNARLAALLDQHPNLLTDTSIGCYVGPHDQMYEADRMAWRQFVIAHSERILFGTDVVLTRQAVNTEMLRQHFLGHVRWVRQLCLPQDVLSRVAHENFERLCGLKPADPLPWGALRP